MGLRKFFGRKKGKTWVRRIKITSSPALGTPKVRGVSKFEGIYKSRGRAQKKFSSIKYPRIPKMEMFRLYKSGHLRTVGKLKLKPKVTVYPKLGKKVELKPDEFKRWKRAPKKIAKGRPKLKIKRI